MDSVQDGDWGDIYAQIMEDAASTDIYFNDSPSAGVELDASFADVVCQENCTRKRDHSDQSIRQGSKACREKKRRDKLNERFSEIRSILEPGRTAKTDKFAILSDAVRVLKQLKAEVEELKEENAKLEEEIKTLKGEKHELREEKTLMKAEKEKIEERMGAMSVIPTGYIPPNPSTYQPTVSKMFAFPSYGGFPMWHWIPASERDFSKDNELRPPVA